MLNDVENIEVVTELDDIENIESEIAESKELITELHETIQVYEGLLDKYIDARLKALPDTLGDLLPDNLTIPQKIAWLDKLELTIANSKPVVEDIGVVHKVNMPKKKKAPKDSRGMMSFGMNEKGGK